MTATSTNREDPDHSFKNTPFFGTSTINEKINLILRLLEIQDKKLSRITEDVETIEMVLRFEFVPHKPGSVKD
jgi:hypothetical protein